MLKGELPSQGSSPFKYDGMSACRIYGCSLFYSDRFCQIPGLIYIQIFSDRSIVGD